MGQLEEELKIWTRSKARIRPRPFTEAAFYEGQSAFGVGITKLSTRTIRNGDGLLEVLDLERTKKRGDK